MPGPERGRKNTVTLIGILLLIVGIIFTISCGVLTLALTVYFAAFIAEDNEKNLAVFHTIWPFPIWATVAFFVENIGLIVAASFLISAVTCARHDNMEASPGCLLCFTIYNASCSTCQVLVAVTALAMHLDRNENHKRNKVDKISFYTPRLVSGIIWLILSLVIYSCLIGCTVPVYQYYDSIRPIAVYPQLERPRTPPDDA